MIVKRFKAESMTDAYERIRADLGEEALILETRRLRGGLLGFGGERVEVLAAVEDSPARRAPAIAIQLDEVRSLLQARVTDRRGILAARFAESGIEEQLCAAILDACEPTLSEQDLASAISRRVTVSPAAPAGQCARVALVGPTGVGKTTTVAKLAARYALNERKKVALITMDTYRIGAVEQLKTYARVMGLPIEVAQSPEEMAAAVAKHADKDAILIDTIGRSPRKALHLAETKAFLNAAEPTETHLVLAAPSGLGYLFQAAESFCELEANRLIITKVDEMPRWGAIVSLTQRTGLPVSFITDGQEVPRNIRPANAGEIALQILGGAE